MRNCANGLRVVFAAVAATGLGVTGAGAASATTITPPGEVVTATGIGSPALSLRAPGYVMDCYTFHATGETPPSGNVVPLPAGDVVISSCVMNNTFLMDIDVHEDLELVVDYSGGDPQGSLVIPEGGMTAWYTDGTARCDLEVDASTVGPTSYDNGTGAADVANQTGLNYTSAMTGVIICPPSGTALVTTTLQLELDGGGHPVVEP